MINYIYNAQQHKLTISEFSRFPAQTPVVFQFIA